MTATTDHLSPATRAWRDQGEFLTIAGRRAFVWQRGQGPTVLLLHGFPTSSFDWAPLAERLADRFRLVALDFWGFGLSDKPVACSYSLFDQADLVEQVARALAIDNAWLVSHDMGTSVHCELLAREAEGSLGLRPRGSVFFNGSMLQWSARITPIQELLASNATLQQAIELCRTQVAHMYLPGLRAIMLRPESVSDLDGTVMQELLTYQDGHLRMPAIAGYMRERYVHAERWLGAFAAASAPFTLLWAEGDPIAHCEMGRELAGKAPHARLVELPGLGHFPMLEDPAGVAAHLAAALEG